MCCPFCLLLNAVVCLFVCLFVLFVCFVFVGGGGERAFCWRGGGGIVLFLGGGVKGLKKKPGHWGMPGKLSGPFCPLRPPAWPNVTRSLGHGMAIYRKKPPAIPRGSNLVLEDGLKGGGKKGSFSTSLEGTKGMSGFGSGSPLPGVSF